MRTAPVLLLGHSKKVQRRLWLYISLLQCAKNRRVETEHNHSQGSAYKPISLSDIHVTQTRSAATTTFPSRRKLTGYNEPSSPHPPPPTPPHRFSLTSRGCIDYLYLKHRSLGLRRDVSYEHLAGKLCRGALEGGYAVGGHIDLPSEHLSGRKKKKKKKKKPYHFLVS